jgi:hypothetical protein
MSKVENFINSGGGALLGTLGGAVGGYFGVPTQYLGLLGAGASLLGTSLAGGNMKENLLNALGGYAGGSFAGGAAAGLKGGQTLGQAVGSGYTGLDTNLGGILPGGQDIKTGYLSGMVGGKPGTAATGTGAAGAGGMLGGGGGGMDPTKLAGVGLAGYGAYKGMDAAADARRAAGQPLNAGAYMPADAPRMGTLEQFRQVQPPNPYQQQINALYGVGG